MPSYNAALGVRLGAAQSSQGIIKPVSHTNQARLKAICSRLCHAPALLDHSDLEESAMRKVVLTLGLLLMGSAIAFAQEMRMPINADDVKWGPAPNVFPAGAQIAVVSGNPFQEGLYVVRLRMPAGYKIPAHNHPTTEYVTVLSGDFHIGMGDKLDAQKGQLLHAGGFAEAPAKMNHYAWSTSEAVVQVHGQGPFAITYVNPADDPSKK
jgi:quercetin dioxygenase-like cupin family protein